MLISILSYWGCGQVDHNYIFQYRKSYSEHACTKNSTPLADDTKEIINVAELRYTSYTYDERCSYTSNTGYGHTLQTSKQHKVYSIAAATVNVCMICTLYNTIISVCVCLLSRIQMFTLDPATHWPYLQ